MVHEVTLAGRLLAADSGAWAPAMTTGTGQRLA
jgi:hypothetical protein